jgi:hypothetical protein
MFDNGKFVVFTVSLAKPHKSYQTESSQSNFGEETASSENMVHDGCPILLSHIQKTSQDQTTA